MRDPKAASPALEMQSLHLWTAREAPWNLMSLVSIQDTEAGWVVSLLGGQVSGPLLFLTPICWNMSIIFYPLISHLNIEFTGFCLPFSSLSRASFQPPCLCWHAKGKLFSCRSWGLGYGRIWANKYSLRAMGAESNGTPLQYSCLENPMDGGAW